MLSSMIVLLPPVFLGTVFMAAAVLRLSSRRATLKLPEFISYRFLIILTTVFYFLFAAARTLIQYYVWSQNELTRILTQSPLSGDVPGSAFDFIFNNRLGYFLFYSYGRFWLNVLISIGVAFVFYLFLKFLQKHRERFFEEGETELGFLTALIVGWPNFVVFVPMIFILVVIVSIFRRLFFGEAYTTLGIPFLLAALIAFLFGHYFIKILHLTALAI